MRVIARRALREFWERHPDAERPLRAWFAAARAANWSSAAELRADYPLARPLGNNRAVFNIGGNKYRLVVRINYGYGIVYIRFLGTHAEYDRIDARTV